MPGRPVTHVGRTAIRASIALTMRSAELRRYNHKMSDDLLILATRLGDALKRRRWMLAVAESCTGGGIAHACTAIPGSSEWFDRGFVTYSNRAKTEMLGVPAELIERYGAVSEEVARAMAEGALQHSPANVAIAVTGIAGPAGGSTTKPVGTVWFAWGMKDRSVSSLRKQFDGDRVRVRAQSTRLAIDQLVAELAR